MTTGASRLFIRQAELGDADELCPLLNDIIRVGGTTAIEVPLSVQDFQAHFLNGPNHLCCVVAEDDAGSLLGFQSLERHSKLPQDWADIATFTRRQPRTPGVGRALFDATKQYAKTARIVAINATIRADNSGGLAYYSKMGFEDYSVNKAVPLADGTLVDRISKWFVVV